ncbi:hypothetical protein VSR82_33505 [Burkholderia sp. JPY481]|uniref:hypothetical protein n=1 Tax=Paraburkholderia sp. JPY465 TaxID=3042285 RepID=UPI00317B1B60
MHQFTERNETPCDEKIASGILAEATPVTLRVGIPTKRERTVTHEHEGDDWQ